jgi:hypothetical protein
MFTPVCLIPVIVGIHCVAAGFGGNQENSLVLAVDDPPEDGLDSPLRLEKLANEVRPFTYSAVFLCGQYMMRAASYQRMFLFSVQLVMCDFISEFAMQLQSTNACGAMGNRLHTGGLRTL